MPIAVFPELPGLTFNVVKRPVFETGKATHVSGREVRIPYLSQTIYEWDLTFDILQDFPYGTIPSPLKRLEGLFLVSQANLFGFLFKDPDDYQVVGQGIGTGDGTLTDFVLVRTFGDVTYAGAAVSEPIGYVDLTQLFRVYFNNTLQDASSYTLFQDSFPGSPGRVVVRFGAPVAAGVVITVDMTYFFYVRFGAENLDFEKFLDRLWLLKKLTLRSIRARALPTVSPAPPPPPPTPPPPPPPPPQPPGQQGWTALDTQGASPTVTGTGLTPQSELFPGKYPYMASSISGPFNFLFDSLDYPNRLILTVWSQGTVAPITKNTDPYTNTNAVPVPVVSITDTHGFTWQKRMSVTAGALIPGASVEVWWADTSSLTNDSTNTHQPVPVTITVHFGARAFIPVFNVVGLYRALNWDTNPSLPAVDIGMGPRPQVRVSTDGIPFFLAALLSNVPDGNLYSNRGIAPFANRSSGHLNLNQWNGDGGPSIPEITVNGSGSWAESIIGGHLGGTAFFVPQSNVNIAPWGSLNSLHSPYIYILDAMDATVAP